MIAARNRWLLALVLLLALGLAWARTRAPGAALGEPLFPGFAPAAVARVELAFGSAPPLELVRPSAEHAAPSAAPSGAWSIAQRFGFPAQAAALDECLARLALLRSGGRVSSDAAGASFGLGAESLLLRCRAADGRVLAELRQGGADGNASFIALPGQPALGVLRVPRWSRLSAEPLAWIDTRVPLPPRERWAAIAFTAGGAGARSGRIALGARGRWQWEHGAELPAGLGEGLARLLDPLYFAEVVAAEPAREHGLAPADLCQIEIALAAPAGADGADAPGFALAIGAELPGGAQRAASCSAWPHPFVVALPAESALALERAIEALLDARASSAAQESPR